MEKVYILKKENLEPWLKSMGKDSSVYVPAQDKKNSIIDFFSLAEIGSELDFSSNEDKRYRLNLTEKTRLSPKYIIYPQCEDLLGFSYEKNPENIEDVKIKLKVSQKETSSIIFGLKPCDVQAIARMDAVFGQGVVKDPYYLDRRKNATLISIGCDRVFADCFCTSVGGSPYNFDNTDIGLMETDDGYVVFVFTDKGRKVVEGGSSYFEPAGEKDMGGYRSQLEEREKISSEEILSLWPDTNWQDIPDILSRSFAISEWKKVSEKCISCGACTFVCPTCYCFDIRDEKDNQQGQRYRCWDFCTSYLYTLEASGHNPRGDIQKRYKNKVNCKYNYNYRRHGHLYCVGCGRCIEVCPVDMDIRQVVATVLKNQEE